MILNVFCTAGYWWVFRESPLEAFPLLGPYDTEAEAEAERDRLAADPCRLTALMSYHTAWAA